MAKQAWLFVLTLNLFIIDLALYVVRLVKGSPTGLVNFNIGLFVAYYLLFLGIMIYFLHAGIHGINLLPSTSIILYFSLFLLLLGLEITGYVSAGLANRTSLTIEPLFSVIMILFSAMVLYKK